MTHYLDLEVGTVLLGKDEMFVSMLIKSENDGDRQTWLNLLTGEQGTYSGYRREHDEIDEHRLEIVLPTKENA